MDYIIVMPAQRWLPTRGPGVQPSRSSGPRPGHLRAGEPDAQADLRGGLRFFLADFSVPGTSTLDWSPSTSCSRRRPTRGASGSETEDFAGFTPGDVALIQRGTCLFEDESANAEAARRPAVILR